MHFGNGYLRFFRTPSLALDFGLNLYFTIPPLFVFDGPSPQFAFTGSGHLFVFTSAKLSICIYRPWLVRLENDKSQMLHKMLYFFLLSNSFVTVIIDRNEAKCKIPLEEYFKDFVFFLREQVQCNLLSIGSHKYFPLQCLFFRADVQCLFFKNAYLQFFVKQFS